MHNRPWFYASRYKSYALKHRLPQLMQGSASISFTTGIALGIYVTTGTKPLWSHPGAIWSHNKNNLYIHYQTYTNTQKKASQMLYFSKSITQKTNTNLTNSDIKQTKHLIIRKNETTKEIILDYNLSNVNLCSSFISSINKNETQKEYVPTWRSTYHHAST